MSDTKKYSISKTEEPIDRNSMYEDGRYLRYKSNDPLDALMEQVQKEAEQAQKLAQASTPEQKAPEKPKAPPIDPRKEELKRLYQSLYEEDKKYEKAKGKRAIVTILIFTAFYFWLIWQFVDSFVAIVPAIPLAVIHFFANATIFGQLSDMSRSENKRLEYIREQIKELEKEIYK